MTAMPAYADALTFFPFRDVAAERIDTSRDFMTRHTRILEPGPQTLFDEHIAVANAARLHFHANLPSAGLRDFAFNYFKRSIRASDLCNTHL
jgi:hypothetical protein